MHQANPPDCQDDRTYRQRRVDLSAETWFPDPAALWRFPGLGWGRLRSLTPESFSLSIWVQLGHVRVTVVAMGSDCLFGFRAAEVILRSSAPRAPRWGKAEFQQN